MVLFILHILGSCANAKIVILHLLHSIHCSSFLLAILMGAFFLLDFPHPSYWSDPSDWLLLSLLLSLLLMTTRKSATELSWILRIFCWMWKGRYFLVPSDLQAHSLHPPHLFFRPETSSFWITVVVQLFFSLRVVASWFLTFLLLLYL